MSGCMSALVRPNGQEPANLVTLHDLAIQELAADLAERCTTFDEDCQRGRVRVGHQALDFEVDLANCLLRKRLRLLDWGVQERRWLASARRNRTNRVAH